MREGAGLATSGMRVSKATEAATVLGIIAVICATYLVGYLISWLLTAVTGYSLTFQLPLVARAFGGILVLLGVAVSGSTMTVRKAREVLDSTSVTLLKLVRGAPLESRGARTESFVPKGPYCWVRNPMYSGVVLSLFGLGVLFSSALILLWGVVVMCYFLLFLIPFEERELDALFGESYREYKRLVPELFPTGRRFRAQTSQ